MTGLVVNLDKYDSIYTWYKIMNMSAAAAAIEEVLKSILQDF